MKSSYFKDNCCRFGFSLIELLVIIAVIAILAVVIPSTLLQARSQSKSIICMSNMQGVTQAWLLYAQDNDSQVCGSKPANQTGYSMEQYPANSTGAITFRSVWNFVGSPHDKNGSPRNDGLQNKLRAIRVGALWAYIQNERLFNCPADTRYLKPPTGDGGGTWGKKGGYRTYSLGAVYNTSTSGWTTGENVVMAYSTQEIVSPSEKFVFIEESDGYGFNSNTWNMFLNTRSKWGDSFAVLHNQATMFSYADGHAEPHRWQNQSTLDMAASHNKLYPIPADETEDFDWFRWRYVPGEMPEIFKNL